MTTSFNYTVWPTGVGTGPMHKREDPKEPPTDLVTTRTQQTITGWVGQILVAGRVVYETEVTEDAKDAIETANRRLIDKVVAIFRD